MKKLKISLYMLALTSLFASCEDTLDLTQPGQVSSEETYTDMTSIKKNLYGIYATVSNNSQIEFNSVWTDEAAIGLANGGQGISDGMYGYVLNPSNDNSYGIWYSNYSTINNCNRFLYSVNKFIQENLLTNDEITILNHYMAEVRGLRAYAYNELMTYFVSDYTNDSALGVILFDDIPQVDSPLKPRASVGEVYTFIDDDLEFLNNNILSATEITALSTSTGFAIRPTANIYHVGSTFYNALKARISLYRGNYQDALDYANISLTANPIVNRNGYVNVFKDDETLTPETIFKLSRTNGSTKIGANWASINATASGSPFFEVSRSLFNKLRPNPNATDIRLNVITHPSRIVSPNYTQAVNYITEDVLPVGKYVSKTGINLLADAKVFRASEILLIRAEANIRLGNTADAQTDLNALQNNRVTGVPAIALTGDLSQDLKVVLDQRRLELAFEGFRWVDMKRLAPITNAIFDRDQMDCRFNNSCGNEPLPGDYRYTLPIPASEISVNTQVIQNTGY